ncbi:hypothetical protein Tco_1327981 [Tanacetum coccineum]
MEEERGCEGPKRSGLTGMAEKLDRFESFAQNYSPRNERPTESNLDSRTKENFNHKDLPCVTTKKMVVTGKDEQMSEGGSGGEDLPEQN